MTLRQKNYACIGMMMAGIPVFLLASYVENAEKPLSILACLLVMGGLLLHMRLVRCRHCGTWIGKFPGEYCRHCGKPLDWGEE